MPEPKTLSQPLETTEQATPATIDFATIAAMFTDDEQPAPVCDLENPESCESCQ